MSILSRLRKPSRKAATAAPTAAEIADLIEAQRAALAVARARIADSEAKRHAALDDLDPAGMKAAEDYAGLAMNEVEVAERAISLLEAEHAKAQAAEERGSFRAEVEAAQRAGAAISDRIRTDYPRLAAELASLLAAIEQHNGLRLRLLARGKELGEVARITEAEAFRRQPREGVRYVGVGHADLLDAVDLPGLHAGDSPFRFLGDPALKRGYVPRY